jgi:hypothetical protein
VYKRYFEGFVSRENDLLIADVIILDGTESGGGTVLVDGMCTFVLL